MWNMFVLHVMVVAMMMIDKRVLAAEAPFL